MSISKTIDQRYRLESISLLPGMGEIFRAYDVRLYRPVMAWFLPKSRNSLIAAFLQEYDKFLHLNICSRPELYDKGIDKVTGQPYLVFEPIHGCKTLHDFLEGSKTLSPGEAIKISIDLLEILDALHRPGVVHNRVNTKNILYHEGTVMLIGIGLNYMQPITIIPPDDLAFLSPEQLSGTTTSELSDLYAVGMLLYRMLFGQLLFTQLDVVSLIQAQKEKLSTSSYLISELSERSEFADLLSQLLAFEPSNRFQDAKNVIAALERIKQVIGEQNE